MKSLVAIAGVCLTVGQLAPFAILPLAVELKYDKVIQARANAAIEKVDSYTMITGLNDNQGAGAFSPITNQTLELDGYGTIGYNTEYFELIDKDSTGTKKVIKYDDLKTRLTIGFVTGLSDATDIPGYITQKIAGVNTTTNDKYELPIDSDMWMVVPSKELVDEQYVRVYYLLSADGDSAMWIKANIDQSYDSDRFDAIIASMLKSKDVYYRGKTVFTTPKTGYYAENKPVDENKASGQGDYKQNGEEHKVYQNEAGFVKSDISKNWTDLELILDKAAMSVPCTVNDLLGAGFKINDPSGLEENSEIFYSATQELILTKGTTDITVLIKNDSASEKKKVKQCRIFDITIDIKGFKQTTGLPDDYVVLPGGMTLNIYTDKVLEYYGTPNSSEEFTNEDGTLCKRYTWKSGNKTMIIEAGIVANITKVRMSME